MPFSSPEINSLNFFMIHFDVSIVFFQEIVDLLLYKSIFYNRIQISITTLNMI